MNIETVRNAINQGQFDADLDTLISVAHDRQKDVKATRTRQLARTLRAGDTATLTGLRPKALNGQTVTIQKVNRTRVEVTFNDPSFAARYPGNASIPMASLIPTGKTSTDAPPPPAAAPENTGVYFNIGKPVTPPAGLHWEQHYKWMDEYTKDRDVLRFQIADGYATYEVRGRTLHHIQAGDAYEALPATLRGLTKEEADAMLEYDRRMDELFQKN